MGATKELQEVLTATYWQTKFATTACEAAKDLSHLNSVVALHCLPSTHASCPALSLQCTASESGKCAENVVATTMLRADIQKPR